VFRTTARAALAVLAASVLLAGCSPAGRPLARVGTRTLTSADLLDAARGNELQYPGPPEEAKERLLEDLVRREIMLEASHMRGSDTTRFSRDFLASITDRFTLEALYARLGPQDPGVTDGETRRFYEWRGVQAAAHVIYSPERSIVEAAAADLARGEPFAVVADRFNLPGTLPPGGAVGMVAPGALVPPLDDALRTLPIGQVGGPYDTPQGTFLLMVSSRGPAQRPAFELMQSQLAEMLRQRKTRQVMSTSLIGLRNAYAARLENGAAARLFRLLTPARVGDAPHIEPTPAERGEVLARWTGGQYTLGDAVDDLKQPELQKPAASMTPAIEQWLQGQVLTRLAREEAKRRHLGEDPAVARRIRGEYERYLLESEYQASIAAAPPPDEAMLRQVWDMLKGQYQQVSRANVQWVIVPDSATAARISRHGGHGGGTIEDAVRMAGAATPVHKQVVAYPTTDPDWASMSATLARMQPGEWAGPDLVQGGYKFFQLIDKAQDALTFEKLTPDLRASLESNALQLVQERRLKQYTDSLQALLQPNLYKENLRFVPWPAPATIDVGR
jgi:hypothetical protein